MDTNTPLHWPFPALDPVQARNRELALAEYRRIEHQRQQQRLQECLERLGEALL
jgi:hypothetical protein